MATALDKKAVLRDKRAQGLAAMGLVNREGARFRVATSSVRGKRTSFEVWRDEENRVRCTCREFEEQSQGDAFYRCEHILAVKYALLNKSSEAVTKPAHATPSSEREGAASPVESKELKEPGLSSTSEVKAEQTSELGSPAPMFNHTLKLLRQPFDPELVSAQGVRRDQEDIHFDQITWDAVVELLDRVVPTWSHSVRSIVQLGESIAVTAAITIDGVTREGIGTSKAENEASIKIAEQDALKCAALKFGVARNPYGGKPGEPKNDEANATAFPVDPLARSMADLVTPKQLGMIRALGRERNVDVDGVCRKMLRCRTDELSRIAASGFIEHLGLLSRIRRAS
jgi:hypothetical protein